MSRARGTHLRVTTSLVTLPSCAATLCATRTAACTGSRTCAELPLEAKFFKRGS